MHTRMDELILSTYIMILKLQHIYVFHYDEKYFENKDLEHKSKDDVPSFPQDAHLKKETIIQIDA